MPPDPDPLSELLAGASSLGPRCQTCAHPRRAEIEDVCRRFDQERLNGRTRIPWRAMVRRVLRPHYGYEHDHRSLLRHLETCLGIRVS